MYTFVMMKKMRVLRYKKLYIPLLFSMFPVASFSFNRFFMVKPLKKRKK